MTYGVSRCVENLGFEPAERQGIRFADADIQARDAD